jgi:PAS domain-containing protein
MLCPDGILVISTEGKVSYCNEAMLKLVGVRDKSALKEKLDNI